MALLGDTEGGPMATSRTVRDLVFGSGITFTELGECELKGVPGAWALFEIADA